MRLEVIGRCLGSPLGAACSSYLVTTAKTTILLDCGPGALERLWRRGVLERLDAVVISHMHQDHMLDLIPLSNHVTQEALRGQRAGRLPVHLPRTRGPEVLRALGAGLGDDPERFTDAFEVHEYDARDELTIGDLHLGFAPTAHPEPCFATRIRDAESTLV